MLDRFDRLHQPCEHCKSGVYKEKNLWDDWGGMVTCEACGHRAHRHKEEDKDN